MKITLKNSLLAVLTLGLMSGSVLAESELAGQATNPIANLVQLQIQDYYAADSYNAGGDSNLFIVQPVNLFGGFTYNPNDDTDEIAPEWAYKFNITFLFPK